MLRELDGGPLDLFPGVTQKYQEDLAEKEAIEADYARLKLPKPNLPTVYKRNPTPKEIDTAFQISENIIADIHFTDLKTISQQMQADLDFLLAFLETSKRFVNPVKSPESAIAGTMWAIGWRKSMTHLEITLKPMQSFFKSVVFPVSLILVSPVPQVTLLQQRSTRPSPQVSPSRQKDSIIILIATN
ncbi:hypothetical protein PCANC_26843 [Puccinia coronata f. sp. avenae]|uniref:Tet-like 2OG-Fe(II) oxygenase domain-containing protein n=1 Tax=Puccinia coronata f. sp. avenae TaxID=200324 RepID=A0A2N5TQV9_9BASI|nr:hypothetical protein PCANC_26843 [Puccinia coronata f. sp. avenae]